MARDVAPRTLPDDPTNDLHAATKQYAEMAKVSSNDTTAGYLNGKLVAGDNITLTEVNDGGNETLRIDGDAAFEWVESVVVAGVQKTGAWPDAASYQVGEIEILRPLKCFYFLWDIPAAGTYSLFIGAGVSGNVAQAITAAEVVLAAGAVTFYPDDVSIILTPGKYYITCKRSVDTVNWEYYYGQSDNVHYRSIYSYNGGAQMTTRIAPLRIGAWQGKWRV